MDPEHDQIPEADRLEGLWAGGFGDAYSVRNAEAGRGRDAFWKELLAKYPVQRVLEIGCNAGANLQWIAPNLASGGVFGVDVNREALDALRRRLPEVNAIVATARDLPFKDGWFDLAFTTGVLIHLPDAALPQVMEEIVRVSRRYVLCGEYYAPTAVEVPYRGERGALFKRDYGDLYQKRFPSLRLIERGFLERSEGWDDVTWWLFEKS